MKSLGIGVILGCLLASVPASALPLVSVDLDPALPGVQDELALTAPAQLRVDVVIAGVEAAQPLNAFELDLDFDPDVLQALSVSVGSFLLPPVFEVQQEVGTLSVEIAAVTLGAVGASGDGVLASIAFETVGTGTSPLDLNDVLLSAPFGVRIPTAGVRDGELRFAAPPPSPSSAIPEPTSAVLYVAGLAILARRLVSREAGSARPRSLGRPAPRCAAGRQRRDRPNRRPGAECRSW